LLKEFPLKKHIQLFRQLDLPIILIRIETYLLMIKEGYFFVVSKPEIRNKSRIHWLWWKLDVFEFDNYNYIYYCTDPDSGIEQLVNLIKNDIGTNS
jgi:hypothetical protein